MYLPATVRSTTPPPKEGLILLSPASFAQNERRFIFLRNFPTSSFCTHPSPGEESESHRFSSSRRNCPSDQRGTAVDEVLNYYAVLEVRLGSLEWNHPAFPAFSVSHFHFAPLRHRDTIYSRPFFLRNDTIWHALGFPSLGMSNPSAMGAQWDIVEIV